MNSQALGVATQIMVMAIVISVLLLFVGIGVLVLIHVCIVGRALRRGFGNSTMAERGNFGSTSMSQDDLEKLPCFDFKAKQKGTSPVDCAVCLENFRIGDKCRLLPMCNHSFHAQCVDSWLLKTPICPICRTSAESCKGGPTWGEGSSRFSDSGIEFRESQTTASGHHLSDAGLELRESQMSENTHLSDSGVELNENQTASVGALLNLDAATPLHGSVAEPAV